MLIQNDDDAQGSDSQKNLKQRKEKIIQPIGGTMPLLPLSTDGTNDDLLAELREKTARLAEQVHGKDPQQKRILQLDENPDLEKEQQLLNALKEDAPAEQHISGPQIEANENNAAVELVRDKLARLYGKEPDANLEALEVNQKHLHRSKHQQFMYELTTSGRSLADIQTAWHNYYVALPDDEKHTVWKEFYDAQGALSAFSKATQPQIPPKEQSHKNRKKNHIPSLAVQQNTDPRTSVDIKQQLLTKVTAGGKLTPMQHAKSLLFGLAMAALVGGIVTFTFFNEVFIAPFISPSKTVSATPIIGTQTGVVGPESKIIIPKINLEVPVVFGLGSVVEKDMQNALEDGVVHYSTTPNPGELGNAVIVGHSSNNILNSGKYKFAFVLLKRLETDDTFFVQKDGIRYTYKVYRKEVVSPDTVSVLDTQERANTITLITCDPPGTSINRLIIVAEQISPDPAGNTVSTAIPTETVETNTLPSNAPSLWSRIWPF